MSCASSSEKSLIGLSLEVECISSFSRSTSSVAYLLTYSVETGKKYQERHELICIQSSLHRNIHTNLSSKLRWQNVRLWKNENVDSKIEDLYDVKPSILMKTWFLFTFQRKSMLRLRKKCQFQELEWGVLSFLGFFNIFIYFSATLKGKEGLQPNSISSVFTHFGS